MSHRPQSWNRPVARKGPEVPYKNETASNPVARGYLLLILATIIKSSTWIQGILWRLNKFDRIKKLQHISDYEPRCDPIVVPITEDDGDDSITISDLLAPKSRQRRTQYYTSADYHELYKSKKTTPLQVVEHLLSTIARYDDTKPPNRHAVAYVQIQTQLVLAAAEASTDRYKTGNFLGPLDGVPIAVKDEVDLKGYSKSLGTKIDFTNPLNETAWCVRKWEEAGAIIIGKTNMHELGLDTNGFNWAFGTPLNPHNESYYTGGSSGGSACTVAQGICPFALGADGGGSIRVPSSYCGLYGLKPSHGRISGRPTADLACSVGAYGPIASNLDDLIIAYRIMAQPDPQNRTSSSFPSPLTISPKPSLRPQLIGIYHDWIARSSPTVSTLFHRALTFHTQTHNHRLIDITIPYLPESQKSHALTILSEIRAGIPSPSLSHLTHQNQILLSAASSQATAQDFLAAQRLRNLVMEHLAWLWDQYPGMLIVTPTTPDAGWKIGHKSDVAYGSYGASDSDLSLRSMEYVFLANWVGCPAVTVPMGYTEENVPVGLMAMGEWGSEEQLLEWARESEGLLGEEGLRRPKGEGIWVDVLSKLSQ